MKRLRTQVLAARLAATLVAFGAGAGLAAAGDPPATNQLQDIPVFQDRLFGTWSGGDIVAPDSQLPIDTAQVYRGLPSLRFDVVGPSNWWWAAILAGQDSMPYSVEHYRTGGYLEFNVKGAVGGEQFTVALGALDNARVPIETTLDSVGSWNYVGITNEWQHVKIPLSALMPDNRVVPLGSFQPRQLRVVTFGEPYWGPYAKTFWLNDIKFTSPDREPSPPAIRFNQLGYLPIGEKYAKAPSGRGRGRPAGVPPRSGPRPGSRGPSARGARTGVAGVCRKSRSPAPAARATQPSRTLFITAVPRVSVSSSVRMPPEPSCGLLVAVGQREQPGHHGGPSAASTIVTLMRYRHCQRRSAM